MPHRQQRANGVASRDAILDAAAKIAGDRGYDGTSFKLVSELSGLPASSIYWHFKSKDDLLAAVIDRSFKAWSAALDQAEPAPADATAAAWTSPHLIFSLPCLPATASQS